MGWMIVEPLDDSEIVRTDERIANWFVEQRTPALDDWSLFGSLLAETIVKIVVTAIICVVLLWLVKRWLEALVVAVPLILEAMVFITVTWLVDRPRPDVEQVDASPVDSGFPSGHAAAAACYAAIAIVIFWHTRKRWIRALAVVFAAAVPIIVGVARMYRGMHHLTDVVAGVLLGAGVGGAGDLDPVPCRRPPPKAGFRRRRRADPTAADPKSGPPVRTTSWRHRQSSRRGAHHDPDRHHRRPAASPLPSARSPCPRRARSRSTRSIRHLPSAPSNARSVTIPRSVASSSSGWTAPPPAGTSSPLPLRWCSPRRSCSGSCSS